MKMRSFFLAIPIVLAFSHSALSQPNCRAVLIPALKIASRPASEVQTKTSLEDHVIHQFLAPLRVSYGALGQTPQPTSNYAKALKELDNELSVTSVQRAHRVLTEGKATLKFRTTSEAKLHGDFSFKGFFALTKAEIAAVEANPFLKFEPIPQNAIGLANKELQLGEIFFPNVKNADRFEAMLTAETRSLARSAARAAQDSAKVQEANTAILNDLITWTVKEAETQLRSGREAPDLTLALLEWRVKSLGLYYERLYTEKNRYIESSFERVDLNRSNELAEVIVDALAEKQGLVKSGLARDYRPKLTEPFTEWVDYMRSSLSGGAEKRIQTLVKELRAEQKNVPAKLADAFETYYMTRLMTGTRMRSATVASIRSDFNAYVKTHYDKNIPERSRTLLIPIDFIRSFGRNFGRSFGDRAYYEKYYFPESPLYRGVSNPNRLNDSAILQYFSSYKGRYASEVSRSIFDKRLELTQLSMLKFNADLIESTLVEHVTQHAAKHAGYESPNTSKTYLVSATDLNTIAARFAMDKGYITEGSSNKDGNTHLVFEFLLPKHGVVDFSEFKLTDSNWRNYYPRQRETAIAGGLDPNSIVRIYVLKPHTIDEKVPAGGPEKHGEIVRIFERDINHPTKITIRERNDEGEWVTVETVALK